MNQFGVTNPCANIAQHFKVSQALVDAMMEWELASAGVRSSKEVQDHFKYYYNFGRDYPRGNAELAGEAQKAIQAVVADILELARSL